MTLELTEYHNTETPVVVYRQLFILLCHSDLELENNQSIQIKPYSKQAKKPSG